MSIDQKLNAIIKNQERILRNQEIILKNQKNKRPNMMDPEYREKLKKIANLQADKTIRFLESR